MHSSAAHTRLTQVISSADGLEDAQSASDMLFFNRELAPPHGPALAVHAPGRGPGRRLAPVAREAPPAAHWPLVRRRGLRRAAAHREEPAAAQAFSVLLTKGTNVSRILGTMKLKKRLLQPA